MKNYRYDYHNAYGFLERDFIEAENLEEAEKEIRERCRIFRRSLDEGTIKEVASKTAAKDNTNALFEQALSMSIFGE